MRAVSGLHLDYVSPAEYHAACWGDVLGVASFNGAALATCGETADVPVAQVSTPVLPPAAHVCEVWRYGAPAESGECGGVRFRRTAELLFGCIAVAESEGSEPATEDARASGRGAGSPLHQATAQVYRHICATLDTEGYPHLLRVWNYVPDINRDSHGTERYRQFNRARQHALLANGRPLSGRVPAASALGGAAGSPLVAYFLAGRTAPTFVENPRQVSAYHYPRRYGTHSPVFSRAALLHQGGSLALFISGTASIVGHRSLHVGDAAAQTRETLANIEALLGEANRLARGAYFSLDNLACKVYVRRPEDLPTIRSQVATALGNRATPIYLQADICRQDLLVEIEAAAICPAATNG
jgi:chorismate lyase / 3-hydroxybenzoate synthase